MPSYTLLTPANCRRVPWKNGLGTTTEIAVEALTTERFLWRVSIADVAAPGPFSTFTGYDRLIAVIEGVGMTLSVNGGAQWRADAWNRPSPSPARRRSIAPCSTGRSAMST